MTTRIDRGISLIEVLLAVTVLSMVAVAFYGTLISSARGVAIDRLTETNRHLVHDLLERFCHPYSDLALLYPAGAGPEAIVSLNVDDAMAIVSVPSDRRPALRAILKAGGVLGFMLEWSARVSVGTGEPSKALRLDLLRCRPVFTEPADGPDVGSYRFFAVRGKR